MIVIFNDAGRLVVTNNWTVSCRDDASSFVSVTYFDQTHGGEANLALVRITFDEFHKRLVQANNVDSDMVDLR